MTRVLAPLMMLAAAAGPAFAKPVHKQALAAHLGPFLAERLNDCRTCHAPGDTPADEDKPRNPFGERLEEARRELRKAGKPTDIPARFEAVAADDSDGDGVSNLVEVLAGHRPGDPADTPTAAEVAAADGTVARYRKFLAAYPWRPFEALKPPPVPAAPAPAWAANPIDAFIAAGHRDQGLTPRPEADKRTLLRRVTFDLTGLPPSGEELRAFLADPSPDAYATVVDRLLASPRYGERWGRHWMDVWRYSDWAGYQAQVRDSQPHVWRWRDWIVESLNADKGYDRMVVEMLAGDEVAPGDPDTLRATGYLVRNFKLLSRETWMQEAVDHTFLAFQGVTIGCARCHDHMYDPIPQADYYRVRAVFEPHNVRLDRVPGVADVKADGVARAFDADPAARTYLFIRGDERTPDKSAPAVPGALSGYGPKFPEVRPVKLPPEAVAPNSRGFVVRDELAAAAAAVVRARTALEKLRRDGPAKDVPAAEATLALAEAEAVALEATVEADRLDAAGRKGEPDWRTAAEAAAAAQRRVAVAAAKQALAKAAAAATASSTPAAQKKLTDAKATLAKAEEVAAGPPAVEYTKRAVATYPTESTGRRLALARWLTDPANPLAARVAVNHIWLRHFGQALVPSVFDFGKNGRRPVHPALLDWLACRLAADGWRMKPLHRLIVTSRTYRSASTPDAAALARDRDNLYLWRVAPRRLEAEAVRDQLLFVAGRLDPKMGGQDLEESTALTVPRRSLYFRHAHEKQAEFLKLFDAAGVTECYQRRESIVPQQALALTNSVLSVSSARAVARQIVADAGDEAGAFVDAAFRRVLGRPPTAAEHDECRSFLGPDRVRTPAPAAGGPDAPAADAALRRREVLVNALFNHHEFVTVR